MILEDIKKLFKKYDPEALKAQQEREKLEAEARKTQEEALKKRALPGRMVFSMPPPQPSYSGYEPPLPGGDFGFPGAYEGFKTPDLTPPPSAGIKPRGGEGAVGGKKDGKDKKDAKKKKKKEKKEKEKGKEEKPGTTPKKGGAAKEEKPELPSKVAAEVKIINDRLKDFSKAIDDKKDLLGWHFKELMTTPIAKPYSKDAVDKLTNARKTLTELINILAVIPSKMRNSLKKELKTDEEKAAYKKAVVQEFKDFEKKKRDPEKPQELTAYELIEPILTFDATKQLQPKLGVPIQPLDPVAVFALTGGTQVTLDLDNPTDLEAKKLDEINPLKEEETKEIDPTTKLPKKIKVRTNAIKQLKDTYKEAQEKAKD